MLCEEIFAVELVKVAGFLALGIVFWISGRRAEITSPLYKLDVLGGNMPLPLVFRGEFGCTTVAS